MKVTLSRQRHRRGTVQN